MKIVAGLGGYPFAAPATGMSQSCNYSSKSASHQIGVRSLFMLRRLLSGFLILGCAILTVFVGRGRNAAPKTPIPPAKVDVSLASTSGKQTAVFAGGCFWGTQAVFERVKGVINTTAGYAGGSAATATYDQVTTETTGHAESVQVGYDPSKSPTVNCYASSFPSPTIQRSSTGRDRMWVHRIVLRYFTPTTTRSGLRLHISRNSTRRRCFRNGSSLK